MSVFLFMPAIAQKINSDSIKAEMDKIELSNSAMKQMIDRYKKGVIKGDAESMNLLGLECISGKNVKADLEMGITLLDAAAKQDYVDAQYNLASYLYLFWLQTFAIASIAFALLPIPYSLSRYAVNCE